MMHFIKDVTLYSSVKTAKAKIIQAAAIPFKNALLLDDSMLKTLAENLRAVTALCNENFRGNVLEFHHDPGQISVRYPANGSEQIVVSISYAPALTSISSHYQIREEIQRALEKADPDFCAKYLLLYSQKGGIR